MARQRRTPARTYGILCGMDKTGKDRSPLCCLAPRAFLVAACALAAAVACAMPTKRELAQAQGAVAERTAADLRALGDGARWMVIGLVAAAGLLVCAWLATRNFSGRGNSTVRTDDLVAIPAAAPED